MFFNILRIRNLVITVMFLFAATVVKSTTFTWDKNSESNITGYRLHYATTEEGPYSEAVDVGNTNLATLDLLPGTYRVAVTAKAGDLESDYSNPVFVTIIDTPPSNKPGFQLIPLTTEDGVIFDRLIVFRGEPGEEFILEASDNLIDWVTVEAFTINQTKIYNYLASEAALNQTPKQYYRVIAASVSP